MDLGATILDIAYARMVLDALLGIIQQLLVVEWFFEEIISPVLHRFDSNTNVTISSDHDDRNFGAALAQCSQNLNPAHFWQPHIEHDTAQSEIVELIQEFDGVGMRRHLKPDRFEKLPKRSASGIVIIDDIDDSSLCKGLMSLSSERQTTLLFTDQTAYFMPAGARPGPLRLASRFFYDDLVGIEDRSV